MKKLSLLIVIISQSLFSQQNPTQAVAANWNNVLTDKFDDTVTYTNNVVNLPNWLIRHGDTRWLQEQVFTKDQVDIKDGSLILKLTKCLGGCINQEYGGFYQKGSAQTANYKGSEIYTSKKIMYGYIEAKIKLPSGKGAFPGFWLYPIYRQNQIENGTDYNSIIFRKNGYPEEMDIIEQRSILDSDANGTFVSHVYDNYSFWDDITLNNPPNYYGINNQQSKAWEHNVFYKNVQSCNTPIAGDWHTFGLKWDIFGQYYYIDDKLVFTNSLWTRKTNTESMNVLLSNQILTNTSTSENPSGNTIDNTIFDGKQVLFPDDDIAEERIKVDWVKIWQEKKFKNPVVWASGKSDKVGKFGLEVNAPVPDTFIVGNFISTDGDSEILSFSSDGLRSAFQKLTNQFTLGYVHDHNMHVNVAIATPENDVWDVATIKEETRSSLTPNTYTLNNWFTPTIVGNTRSAVGNFDGNYGDELFLSNVSSYFSVLLKFNNTQNSSVAYYEYSELYNSNPSNNTTIPPSIKSLPTGTDETINISANDVFLSGDIDGIGTTVTGTTVYKDELIWINTSTNKITLLTHEVNGSYKWKRLFRGVITGWSIASTDRFLVGNFDKPNANDKTVELLCISASGKVNLYSFNGSGWNYLWGNGSNGKISFFNIGSYGQDTFVSGTFTDQNGPTQLMCISGTIENATTHSYQQFNHIYRFSNSGLPATSTWIDAQLNDQMNQQIDPMAPNYPSLVKHMPYKYKLPSGEYTTTLLSIEKYKNPYNRSCTQDATFPASESQNQKMSNCVKYASTLTNFSSNSITCPTCKNENSNSYTSSFDNVKDSIIAKIYPNPSKGNFTIDFTKKIDGDYKVYSELSSLITEGKIRNSDSIKINISGNAKGLYIIKIKGNNLDITEKVLLE